MTWCRIVDKSLLKSQVNTFINSYVCIKYWYICNTDLFKGNVFCESGWFFGTCQEITEITTSLMSIGAGYRRGQSSSAPQTKCFYLSQQLTQLTGVVTPSNTYTRNPLNRITTTTQINTNRHLSFLITVCFLYVIFVNDTTIILFILYWSLEFSHGCSVRKWKTTNSKTAWTDFHICFILSETGRINCIMITKY